MHPLPPLLPLPPLPPQPQLHIGLFYGSTDGATLAAAQQIAALCRAPFPLPAAVTLCDVATVPLAAMLAYDHIILGAPTWNVGQMQRDWEMVFDDFDALDLSGTHAALFGLGDQVGYPDTFVDALAFFADKLTERGATLAGRWPTRGYSFASSWAVGADGLFTGLVLDAINQPQESTLRLQLWLAQLRSEWEVE